MYTNIQQYFRYYLALILSVLLAVGVRLQAAPLGSGTVTQGSAATKKMPESPGAVAQSAITLR